MFNYRFLIKIITVGLTSLFMITGCAAGISVSPSASTVGEGSVDGGGLPGAPTTTFASAGGSSGSAIVTSESGALTLFVRTGATAFTGNYTGENVSISDPFLEAGINAVNRQVGQ